MRIDPRPFKGGVSPVALRRQCRYGSESLHQSILRADSVTVTVVQIRQGAARMCRVRCGLRRGQRLKVESLSAGEARCE